MSESTTQALIGVAVTGNTGIAPVPDVRGVVLASRSAGNEVGWKTYPVGYETPFTGGGNGER